MGIYTDYFKPVDGSTLVEMLTSHTKHLWTADLTTAFVAPIYYNTHLGGSSVNYPTDGRAYLPFWGSSVIGGGCCDATGNERTWGLAFTLESVNVPEPSTFAIFALSLMGLASRRFKKKS